MATQLFLIPQTQDSNGYTVPEYSATDPNNSVLITGPWVACNYGAEGIVLLATAPNATLSSQPDVFAFPTDLTPNLQLSDVTNYQTFAQNVNLPNTAVDTTFTWQSLARFIAQVCLVGQRFAGLTGGASMFVSVQTGVIGVGIGAKQVPTTLASALTSQPTLSTNLSAVADSFNFSYGSPSSVEDAITSIAAGWTDPIILDAGDGFTL